MTREDKILEIINEYLTYGTVYSDHNYFHGYILTRLYHMLDFYTMFESLRRKGNRDYTTATGLLEAAFTTLSKVVNKYNPTVTPEMALEKEIEVNGVNKKGIKTGKRTIMKFGRWLGQAFPFLTDIEKEKLVDWYSDSYGPINATFYRATTGFEDIVTKRTGKGVGFTTTMWQKPLAHSCMRYSASELGLTEHPYSAYESGDWELCYLLGQDGKLLGRCLLNLPAGTHSAIYGVSKPSIQMLQEEMHKLGYTQASEGAAEWSGSKLLYIEDTWDDEGGEDGIPVFLMPYVDIFEGYAYHDRNYIYLGVSGDRPYNTYHVDPYEANGFNEL